MEFDQSLNQTVTFFVNVFMAAVILMELIDGVAPPEDIQGDFSPTAEQMAEFDLSQNEILATQLEKDGMITEDQVKEVAGFCSFTPTTVVETDHGEQPIGQLHTGEKVLATILKHTRWSSNPSCMCGSIPITIW